LSANAGNAAEAERRGRAARLGAEKKAMSARVTPNSASEAGSGTGSQKIVPFQTRSMCG
jgi:hypothetical protein